MNSLAARIDSDYVMEELRLCHVRSLADEIEMDGISTGATLSIEGALQDYIPSLVDSPGYHWVILYGGDSEICGVISVEKGKFDTCDHNLAIWVKPSHRRKGLCVDAICKAAEILKEDGVRLVEMKVRKDNLPTLAAADGVCRRLSVVVADNNDEYKQWTIQIFGEHDG